MPDIHPHVDRRWASIGQAAEYLKINPRTIREWAKNGRLTIYQFGPNTKRVDLNELEALGGAQK